MTPRQVALLVKVATPSNGSFIAMLRDILSGLKVEKGRVTAGVLPEAKGVGLKVNF